MGPLKKKKKKKSLNSRSCFSDPKIAANWKTFNMQYLHGWDGGGGDDRKIEALI